MNKWKAAPPQIIPSTIPGSCTRPPKGWRCKLTDRHSGACPAYPVGWTRVKLWLQGVRS